MNRDDGYAVLSKEDMATLSGMEIFNKMLAGEIPPSPISKSTNMKLAEAAQGRIVFKATPLFGHYNPSGTVHGGWVGTVLDSAMGCAVHTLLPPGTAYSTVEYKINLVRPLFVESGEVICEGKTIHCGRTIATCEGTLKTKEGKLIAHGSETCAIFPMRN